MKVRVREELKHLPVYQLRGSKWWVVLDDYVFPLELDGEPYDICVPSSYRYDRATIWWEGLITKDSLGCKGPLVHDVICRYHGNLPLLDSADEPSIEPWRELSREDADQIFLAVMLSDQVRSWKAHMARQLVGAVTKFKSW